MQLYCIFKGICAWNTVAPLSTGAMRCLIKLKYKSLFDNSRKSMKKLSRCAWLYVATICLYALLWSDITPIHPTGDKVAVAGRVVPDFAPIVAHGILLLLAFSTGNIK
jgi:hypothetical protein